ncbi:MAG: hypothetical protein ACRDYE_09090, partial [Acidimicrobiales bacterium]
LAPDFDDEIVAGTCVVRDGQVVHGPTAEALGLPPLGSAAPAAPAPMAAPTTTATAAPGVPDPPTLGEDDGEPSPGAERNSP